MKKINFNSKTGIGFGGERYVIDRLKTLGFELHVNNLKKSDSEIDIVVYRYNKLKHSLDIRIIEVKTRSFNELNLSNFGIHKKWASIRKYVFQIKAEVDDRFSNLRYSEIHYDLVLVRFSDNRFNIYKYIKDINLLI